MLKGRGVHTCHPGGYHIHSDIILDQLGAETAHEAQNSSLACTVEVQRGCVYKACGTSSHNQMAPRFLPFRKEVSRTAGNVDGPS